MVEVGKDGIPLNGDGDLRRKHAVIEFTCDVRFPLFSMRKGERWGFVVYGKSEAMLEAVRQGERFEFAGGIGVQGDAVIVYEGDGGRAFSEAAGYIKGKAQP